MDARRKGEHDGAAAFAECAMACYLSGKSP
jgi:hypothetical protein